MWDYNNLLQAQFWLFMSVGKASIILQIYAHVANLNVPAFWQLLVCSWLGLSDASFLTTFQSDNWLHLALCANFFGDFDICLMLLFYVVMF